MRPSAYWGIVGAVALAALVVYFDSSVIVVRNNAVTATSTGLAVLPTPLLPALELPSASSTVPAASSTPSSPKSTQGVTPHATPPVPPQKTPAPIVSEPAEQPAALVMPPVPTALPAQTGDISTSAAAVRAALVNIICNAPYGGKLQSISGSGIVIDPRGVILTNAHIGQYFLLADRGVSCFIRAGSPAHDAYEASLAFISPAWLSANATAIKQHEPTGTGEHDFALLVITKSVTATPLPASFPYVPEAHNSPAVGEGIVIGSYAAQFLSSSAIQDALYPTIVYGSIKDVYTFDTNTVDLVSLGGTVAAQEGSSGGGVVNALGSLVATITTSTVKGDTSTRQLNAITASYIRRAYAAETGYALSTLLAKKPSDMVADFAPQIPALEAKITAGLSN